MATSAYTLTGSEFPPLPRTLPCSGDRRGWVGPRLPCRQRGRGAPGSRRPAPTARGAGTLSGRTRLPAAGQRARTGISANAGNRARPPAPACRVRARHRGRLVTMVDHEALVGMLGRLRLTVIRDQLDSLLDEAARREMTLREALAFVCEREVARRAERRVEMALKIAHFPFVRDLQGFDFAAQPSLDPKQVRELATGRFVANGEAVLLLGPPGVGKTHLAVALGHEAIRQGYSVMFATAPALVAALAKAHVEGRLE